MELILFRPAEYQRLYGCDHFKIEQIPLEDRQDIWNGVILICLFFVFEILYIPCMISLWKNRDNPCYKMLFYIGVTDMLVMLMNGLETGLLGIQGAVFCTYPTFIYVTGIVGLSLWFAETLCEFLLALNRCLELIWPKLAHKIYGGNNTWWIMLIPTIYAMFPLFFTPPILFSGIYFSWFFNPYVGYVDDFGKIYHSLWHTVHDSLVIVVLSAIYVTFSVMLVYRTKRIGSIAGSEAAQPSFSQKMTFLQVVIISFFNAAAAGIYIYMQLTRISNFLIIAGTYAWLFAHGSPPLVYICLNRTIRRDFMEICNKLLFKMGLAKRDGIASTAVRANSRPINNWMAVGENKGNRTVTNTTKSNINQSLDK